MVGISRRAGGAVFLGFVIAALGIAGYFLVAADSLGTATTAAGVAFPFVFAGLVLGYLHRVGRRPDGGRLLGAAALGALVMAGISCWSRSRSSGASRSRA
jgi:hypothetical protein